jgi:hypothetical protein
MSSQRMAYPMSTQTEFMSNKEQQTGEDFGDVEGKAEVGQGSVRLAMSAHMRQRRGLSQLRLQITAKHSLPAVQDIVDTAASNRPAEEECLLHRHQQLRNVKIACQYLRYL